MRRHIVATANRAARTALVAAGIYTMSLTGLAQGLTGVTGKVTDPSGAVIPGVEITVTNNATGMVRTGITNETGLYTVTQLQPGTYTIRAELTGFKAKQVSSVALPVNETVTLNLPLEVGEISDVVDVVASAEVVNTVDAKLGVGFDQKKIIDLPLNARNIVGLLTLQTGVTISEKTSDFARDDGGQVNGARNDQQNIVLDGVNVNAQERGSSLEGALPTTLDSVQEFIVQTAGGGGGAQRGSGAQIQLVTKGGSNEWHGSAYEFYRTTGTSARNYFASEPARLIRHLPGGSIGGPVRKDRLFFFGAFERNTDRSATLESKTVPTPEFLNGIVRYQRRDGSFGVVTDGPGGALERLTGIPGDRFNPNVIGPNGIYERYRPFSTDTTRTRAGVDNGANFLQYRFNAPFIRNRNVYISRIDYTLNAKHALYARGTLNDDVRTLSAETFPGFNNPRQRIDNSKGFAANWNAVITPALNSNFTAGLTRESFEDTGNQQAYYSPPRVSNFIQTTGSQRQAINTWNFVENLSWVKGNHNIQAGVNYRFIDNKLISFDAVSPATYSGAANLTGGEIGTANNPGLRRALGDAEFLLVRDPGIVGDALMAATGSASLVSYGTQFDLQGRPLATGSPFVRNYALHEWDYFVQDTWRMRPNFTVTASLAYQLQTPPYERNGIQVNWTQHLGQRLKEQSNTTKDVLGLPLYEVQVMGRANELPDYYSMDTNNFAPRASIAWTPSFENGVLGLLGRKGGQMVVRGGYTLTYDRVGGRFARDAALVGSVGLLSRYGTPGFSYSLDGLNGIPRAGRVGPGGALPAASFPAPVLSQDFKLPASAGGAGGISTTGIDSGLHSPTNQLVNLTISKELPGGWVLEGSYVGRLARELVGQLDMASPVNVRDPRSGMTYYQAIGELMNRYEFNRVPVSDVQPIAWFENVYPRIKEYAEGLAAFRGRTFNSATQAFYALINQGFSPGPNAPVSISDQWNLIERSLRQARLLSPQTQFFGLWNNSGRSNYHSGQFTVRKRFSSGYTVTGNYTFSKSLDITSAAEARGNRANGTTGEGLAADPYNPDFSYALSDFNRRHQFNANFLAELPFGRDRWIGRSVPAAVDHIIGGWQLSGIVVATSGRPFNFTASNRFNHHYFGRDIPHLVRPIDFELTKQAGRVYLIPGTSAQRQAIAEQNFRNSVPGGAVARNQGLGPSFFNVDLSLTKNFRITERVRARFRWEAFNAFNHANFNIPSTEAGHNIDRGGGTLGEITGTIGTERVMQFSFRLEF